MPELLPGDLTPIVSPAHLLACPFSRNEWEARLRELSTVVHVANREVLHQLEVLPSLSKRLDEVETEQIRLETRLEERTSSLKWVAGAIATGISVVIAVVAAVSRWVQ